MIKDDTLVVVRNRNNGSTGYTLPDNNIRRSFAPGEEKKIPFAELRSLQYVSGGDYILRNLLIINDKEALDALSMKVEPEYFYTEKEIRDLLLNKSMDEFLDFLDFASQGAIEIAKDIAVKEQVPDTRKREALSKKTGFNIDNAIQINKIMDADEEDEKNAEAQTKERRVKPKEENVEAPQRRTATPQYNVVKK